jgi:hypothetical protein
MGTVMSYVRRTILPAAVITAAIGGLATATALTGQQSAVPPANSPADRKLAAGTETIPATTGDPDGRAPYGVLSYRSISGKTCVTAGQVRNGRVGRFSEDGSFAAFDAGDGPPCADYSNMSDALPVDLRRRQTAASRTNALIFYGIARADVASMRFTAPNGSNRTVKPTANRTFITTYPAALGQATFNVLVTMEDGRTVHYESASPVLGRATVDALLRDAKARRQAGQRDP